MSHQPTCTLPWASLYTQSSSCRFLDPVTRCSLACLLPVDPVNSMGTLLIRYCTCTVQTKSLSWFRGLKNWYLTMHFTSFCNGLLCLVVLFCPGPSWNWKLVCRCGLGSPSFVYECTTKLWTHSGKIQTCCLYKYKKGFLDTQNSSW